MSIGDAIARYRKFTLKRTRKKNKHKSQSLSGNYLHDVFKEDLRKYVCAFLNSGGGTLLVGVDNDGIVQGINCSQKQQDHLQLLVDSILKRFHPPLLPHSYSLTFVPVVKAGPDSKNLKVLRLSVRPPSSQCKFVLYKTDQGAVFIRMDGSVEDRLIQQREKKVSPAPFVLSFCSLVEGLVIKQWL